MAAVVFYFQVHQPYRLRRLPEGQSFESVDEVFDQRENERILRRVAKRCYLPMNALLAEVIDASDGEFCCSFSISGTALQQLEAWAPDALESFVELAETGRVEFLCETSHHSLACFADEDEFAAQIAAQRSTIARLFGKEPTTFRNTELVLDERIAKLVESLGFDVILGEGADHLLGWRSSHYVYQPNGCTKLRALLRDYLFSDDIAFRFSNPEWPQYPLMAETFVEWLGKLPAEAPQIGLFMDYETFGEHQGPATGIFEFMRHMPGMLLEAGVHGFATPSEFAETETHPLAIPEAVSWADAERDVSAWLGNPMQKDAHDRLYALRGELSDDADCLEAWRRLTTSDHVYYMCTKRRSDGDVHDYFSPYYSPHDAYLLFVRALEGVRELHGSPAAQRAAQRAEDLDQEISGTT